MATHVPSKPLLIAPLPAGALPGSERPKIRRPIKTALLSIVAIVVVWALLLIWAGFDVWGHAHRVNYIPSGNRPSSQPGTTYLLVGSDSREGLTPAQQQEYATGGTDVSAGVAHTDTIMLVHTGSNGTVVISIPRDSIVNIPTPYARLAGQQYGTSICFNPPASSADGVCSKINAAYGDGAYDSSGAPIKDPNKSRDGEAQSVVQTVEQATGIRIDGFIEIGLAGLPQMVDAVGGITICPDRSKLANPAQNKLADADSGAFMPMGCQHADGRKALAFARDRHDFASGDLQRAEDQRQVIAAVMHKLQGLSFLLNPFRLDGAGKKVVGSIELGNGMSLWQAYDLFGALKALSAGKAKSCAVPNSGQAAGIEWDQTKAPLLFNLVKTDQVNRIGPSLCTPTGR